MRKSLVMFIMLAGILVMALPVWAAPLAVSDADLAGITGKDVADLSYDGTASAVPGPVVTLSSTNKCDAATCIGMTSGNMQLGSFSWTDDHSADASDHKGANDISGTDTTAQQNVVATDNVINWGAYSSMHFTADTVGGSATQIVTTHAVQDIGGF
jgi:hypothetical protein